MKNFFRIAEISVGTAGSECSFEIEFEEKRFEIQRFAANFSIAYIKDLMKSLRNDVDAFAISDMPTPMRIRGRGYVHNQYFEIMSTPSSIPISDGSRLRELVLVNRLMESIQCGEVNPEKGIFFPIGLLNLEVVSSLWTKYHSYLGFGDLFCLANYPKVLSGSESLVQLAKLALSIANMGDMGKQTPKASSVWQGMGRSVLSAQIRPYHYIFSDPGVFGFFEEDLAFIRDKTVIVPWSFPRSTEILSDYRPRKIIDFFPKDFRFNPNMNYALLDAILRLSKDKRAPLSLAEWERLLRKKMDIHPQTRRFIISARPSTQSKVTHQLHRARSRLQKHPPPDFAFVVHPLSQRDIFRVPGLTLLKNTPNNFRYKIEKGVSNLPGFSLGRISQIVSQDSGREVNGLIYALLSTPKIMKREAPEVTYRRIEKICHHAASQGAKLIGLGAYTKVVGDSGATINANSPIPVTTGNSLSASSTLWAVHEVVKRLGILKREEGTHRFNGTAMVIGATGSIGRVSAKLISMVIKKLVLVAPRRVRLEELAHEINQLSPDCEVIVTTDANELAPEADILVTATSAFDQKVVSVERLKVGCVVCDCSRPLDFSIEDAMKRPDVLIIESGEVVLPGPVNLSCDLGLPDDSVYACLGETALLALENRYEPFTLGRDIDWMKVREIYRLANKHGLKLATIRGHIGIISDKDIALTRKIIREKTRSPYEY
jgi:predicted amino acid dehydrogenase